ncbi:MAG: ribosome maturation factor RimP [Oscillospiraceae bacterium]|jgi:ribosome maturation factor RimP|nr:ribosome maturation factor RimP [Oscillospiraceae bacterium]
MAKEKKKSTVSLVEEMAGPVAEKNGLKLWDVRFEKEGSLWYLRIFIDKEGGVSIEDCETVSRAVSTLLDEADPIEQSYILQVSSPGVERELVKQEHFDAFMGNEVHVRLIRPVEGVRDFIGTLEGADGEGNISILMDEDIEMTFHLKEAAFVRLTDNQAYPDDMNMEELENE